MELKTNYPTADHKYGVQWDKRSRIFQLISKKCPKSTDDMELKTNYPTADHKYGVQRDKRSRIFELISKKYGMQWDKRSRIFQLILKKCPKSRDDAEVKKKKRSHCTP